MVRLGRRAAAVCAYHQAAEVPQCTTQPSGCHVDLGSRQSVPLSGSARRRRAHRARSGGELLSAYRQATAATNLPPTPRRGARLPPTPRTGWSSWCARPGSASTDTTSTPMTTPDTDLGRFGVFTWDPGSSFLDLGLAVAP